MCLRVSIGEEDGFGGAGGSDRAGRMGLVVLKMVRGEIKVGEDV